MSREIGSYWVKMNRKIGEKEKGKFYKVTHKEGSPILLTGVGDFYTDDEHKKEIAKNNKEK
jgi:hypothetical protein